MVRKLSRQDDKKIENFKKIKVRSLAKLSIPILIGTVSRETFLKTSGA